MSRTRVKICGITSIEDAMLAVEAGADAIGMVFYKPSPRFVEVKVAAAICQQLPPFVTRVGLFVNEQERVVREVIDSVELDLLQFHGQEDPQYCEQFNLAYIKAIAVKPDIDIYEETARFTSAKACLLDTWHPEKPGGTGEAFDWSAFPDKAGLPLILAGGLNESNVAEAISLCRPYAVDVSGGVEASPGIKSKAKIRTFINRVISIEESV